MTTDALTDAATSAPSGPGVYFFLGVSRSLLYVGKAGNLRRRLADHARNQRSRPAFVHWMTCTDEEEAFRREADLIVFLRPSRNRAHSDQDRHCYVRVGDGFVDLVRTVEGNDRTYGSFPHLAKGSSSHTSVRQRAGYVALLRLLWVAQGGDRAARIPGRIAGDSPPVSHRTPIADHLRAPLHDLLTGRSARLLDVLDLEDVPAFMRRNLGRDVTAAREWLDLGPRRLRELRLRHGLPVGPVSGDAIAEALATEVRAAIGDFRSPAGPAPDHPLGRREARRRQLRPGWSSRG